MLLLISTESFSQDWLAKPLSSPYISALEGTWVSEPYQFMGNTNTDVITITNILNGQYLEVNVKTSSPGFTYEAKEIIRPGDGGSMTGTHYDIFGKGPSTITYSGSQDGSKIKIMGVGISNSRDIEIDGNSMIQNVTFTMGERPGLPENKIIITYKK